MFLGNKSGCLDAYYKDNFALLVMLFCTINDFATYGNLSSYSVNGHYESYM